MNAAPSDKLRLPAKLMMGMAVLFSLPAFYFILDDLSYHDDFLDGLVAALAGVFAGGCGFVFAAAWVSLTRRTARWQTVWFVFASLAMGGIVSVFALLGMSLVAH